MPKVQSSSVFAKYPKECKFNGDRVLNIGCGFAQYPAKNVINLDAFDNCKPNITWDLSKTPLPFKDNEFDFIIANHILEHVPNWWNVVEECARILKPGGKFEVWVPGPGTDSVLGYRDHINTINECSWYGTKELSRNPDNAWAVDNFKGHALKLSLKFCMKHLNRLWWLIHLPDFIKRFAVDHLRNVVYEVGFMFEKVEA